ncbi:helix-turn-helix domain-containing protein [Streptomyces rapamycinicus]|uniref:helix-turn-helix domain-containing protein n=1 Tax=Streptomyces rapamycinicus TaxID=1226757 RepID=UPI0013157130|nr:helix-turn-helix domain-containing protein [Streptomyces rapamycinicus]UTO64301.1 helix-turn-helix domain-containing protein [Streptomyces rapamycinicus]UTP32256.1 helix-turn-helix domain-containing protein [Streptomyces rapamycinicus NRRL 5491]
MKQGYSNTEACRVLGINRRTGKRWRNSWHMPNSGKPKPLIHMAASASSGMWLTRRLPGPLRPRPRGHAPAGPPHPLRPRGPAHPGMCQAAARSDGGAVSGGAGPTAVNYGLWVTQSSSAGQRCAQSGGSVSL